MSAKILLLLVFVLGIAVSAAAGPNDNWIVYLKAADSSGGNSLAGSCIYGTKTGATDSPAEATNDTSNLSATATTAALGCFNLGSGIHYAGYSKDLRAPYDPVSHPLQAWNLRLWVGSQWNSGDLYLTGWNQIDTYALNGNMQLALKVVSDPTGTYASGTTLYTFGTGTHGTSSSPEFTAVFHNLSNIEHGGYVNLQLSYLSQAVDTPEPASMLSLLSLLGGLSGFIVVRKRRS